MKCSHVMPLYSSVQSHLNVGGKLFILRMSVHIPSFKQGLLSQGMMSWEQFFPL